MGEWIPIDQWDLCAEMARPGIVFEIKNGEGLSLFTPCVTPMPPMPSDWRSMPVQFRAVAEAPPRHSEPLPKPPRA